MVNIVKRIIVLLLTVVMLLGVIPAMASADEVTYFTGVSLALKESIAISFKADHAAIAAETFTKVEFWKNGSCVQTVNTLPEADANGKAAFTCTMIAPSELGTDVTAKLFLNGAQAGEYTASVYAYCAAVLADANAAAELKTLVVDMLNYGAAAQTYVEDTNALVNAQLTDKQKALGTAADAPLPLTDKTALGSDPATVSARWSSAALYLRDSVAINYKFQAESVDGLHVDLACNGRTWSINNFVNQGSGVYSFLFAGLNPAMMRDEVTAVVMNGETAVSPVLTYSIETYAAQVVADAGADAKLVALVKAMMRYGDAAAAYVEGAPAHRYDENGRCTVCTTAHFTADKNVYIETESVDLLTAAGSDPLFTEAPLYVENNAKWSGGTAIRSEKRYTATAGYAADAVPHISFTVTPEEGGKYYIWVRGASNDYKFKYFVDDDKNTQVKYELTSIGSGETSEKWFCLPKSFEWTAGNDYMVRFRVHDTLVRLDQFVITKDASFDPANHTHTPGTEYTYDSEGHGAKAACCYGAIFEKTAHSFVSDKCICGYERFKQVIQAEDANLMTVQDTTVTGTTNPPTKVYEITETTGKISEDGNVVRMYVSNTTEQEDNAPAHLSFDVTPEEAGSYDIWIKYYLTGSETSYTRVWQKVEGLHTSWTLTSVKPGTGFTLGSNANYGWFKLSTADWEAGETYTVGLRSQAIALYIDEFIVTNDANYDPANAIEEPVLGPNMPPIG